jgi:4-amino-4-deoxy-L-arabinose transferase-like glycosyltransferase
VSSVRSVVKGVLLGPPTNYDAPILLNWRNPTRMKSPTIPQPRLSAIPGTRRDRPIPLWMLLPLFFVGVYLTHIALLRLPYYWDEAGYYIPAAWDFFRTGSLIPSTTLSNAHPPLPSIYLALWWKLGGMVPSVTRTAVCLIAATALLGIYRLALVLTGRIAVAAVTAILTAIYPVWFAQSTLAQADLFAAAATLWALSYAFAGSKRDYIIAAILFAIAALCKETAIAVPFALALYELAVSRKQPASPSAPPLTTKLLALAAPLLPLAAWYAWHWHKTGYIFGNPEFLRYNATATLTPLRILLALGHRIIHITAYMNLFVPVMCMFAAMILPALPETTPRPNLTEPRTLSLRPRVPFSAQGKIYVIIAVNVVLFSVLGGALLTRYLLPLYPLIILLCVNTWRRRVHYWPALAALTAIAFLAGLLRNPPYRFAPEDNLAYADVIRLHQQAIARIVRQYPHATVLTAWPATDELTKPELGYVRQPIPVVKIENFSLEQIQKAAHSTEAYSVAFPFSTKYDPPNLPFNLGPKSEEFDTKYFDFHHDLPPEAIAHLLGGEVIWEADRNGQWAAVLHFDRPQLAEVSIGKRRF